MATSRQFDVKTGVEDGTDEATYNSCRCHAGHHDGRLAQQAREGGIEVDNAITNTFDINTDKIIERNTLTNLVRTNCGVYFFTHKSLNLICLAL